MFPSVISGAYTEVSLYPTTAEGIAAMVRQMIAFARTYSVDPRILAWARGAVRDCRELDSVCEVVSLYEATRARARYTRDPIAVDVIANPVYTLEVGGEDCDGLTCLFSAGALAVGHRVRFLLGSRTAPFPTHVLPAVWIAGQWIPVELSSATVPLGQMPPGFRLMQEVEL